MGGNWWDAYPDAPAPKRAAPPPSRGGNWWDEYPDAPSDGARGMKPADLPGTDLRKAPEPTWGDYAQKYFGGASTADLVTGGTLSAIKPFREWYQGTPERNQARAEGLPMDAPTPADLVNMATMVYGAGAGAPGAFGRMVEEDAPAVVEAVAGPTVRVGREAARRVLSHPRTKAAALGAVPGILDLDPKEALEGAAVGAYLGGERAPAAGTPLRGPRAVVPEGKLPSGTAWPSKAPPGQYWRQAADGSVSLEPIRARPIPAEPAPSPIREPGKSKPATIVQPRGHYTAEHPDAAQPPVKAKDLSLIDRQRAAAEGQENPLFGKSRVPQAEGPPPAGPDPGKVASNSHREKVAFARAAAQQNPKIGERVYMELDEGGKPIKVLTEREAKALDRKGGHSTWIKNLWQEARDFS